MRPFSRAQNRPGREAGASVSRAVVCLVVSVLSVTSIVHATERYVAPNGVDAENCTDSSSPCLTIQYAIHVAAASGDNIFLSPGIYTENVSVSKDIVIRGGGQNSTTVDGNAAGTVFNIDAATVTLSDIRITNGNDSLWGGGGIFNREGSLTLNNCTVVGNIAQNGGGIYSSTWGTVTLNDSTVSSNNAVRFDGGGIENDGGTLTLNRSFVSANSAASSGGGISATGGSVTLNGSSVSGNTASLWGGGIYTGLALTLNGSSVMSNTSGDSGGGITSLGDASLNNSTVSGNLTAWGGGIDNAGSLMLSNSTVNGNSADGPGGGIYNWEDGGVTLNNSTITANTARGSGGGIANQGTVTLNNSTVSANSTSGGDGGGLESWGSAALNNSTISDNTALRTGGGIHTSIHSVTLRHALISGNRTTAGQPDDCHGEVTSVGYNLIGDTTECTITGDTTGNIIGVDPLLGPLQINGGATETHALLPGSPAIDAGDPDGCDLRTDQRGERRHADGDCDTEVRCDIGAFELQGCGAPANVYESADPDMTGAVTVGTAMVSPFDYTPPVDDLLFYQLDDGLGWPDLISLAKGWQGLLIYF